MCFCRSWKLSIYCYKVESLYISSAIESNGEYAFAGCTSISEIQLASKKAITANYSIFSNETYNNATLYVPVGSKSDFEKAIPWINFYIQEKDYAGIEDIVADVIQQFPLKKASISLAISCSWEWNKLP